MTSNELLRRLRRAGANVVTDRGKGGHVMVTWRGRRAFVPTGSGEVKQGTLLGILKQLGCGWTISGDGVKRWLVAADHPWLGR